ncbi:MAG: PadR family transcriptional regulator [Candidatus Thermoplasmatota archaeon]|nr:PadR family transcriptional regulator [Candidatus Thermoplasmatota archaeon]
MNHPEQCLFHENKIYPEKSWLKFLILRVIFEKPTYGYDIIQKIEEISYGRHKIKSGTMYTTLRRMEKEKLLISSWKKNKSGPDQRQYHVTKKGKNYLKNYLQMIIERKKMIDGMATFYYKHFGGSKE